MALDRSAIAWKNLNVTQNGKTVSWGLDRFTDDNLLKQALGRADNKGALASGWGFQNGNIVRLGGAAPVPTPAQPTGYDPIKAAEQARANQAQANATGVAAGGVAPAAPPVPPAPPVLTPEQMFRGFIDGTYNSALRNAKTGFHKATDGLTAKKGSLTETRPEYGGGTMYDQLYKEAQEKFFQERRGVTAGMNQRGLLVSGAHNRKFGELAGEDAKRSLDLDKQYGASAVRDLDLQIGQENEAYRQNRYAAAEDLIGRQQAKGTQISQDSINAIMQMLQQFGGELPVGGK